MRGLQIEGKLHAQKQWDKVNEREKSVFRLVAYKMGHSELSRTLLQWWY